MNRSQAGIRSRRPRLGRSRARASDDPLHEGSSDAQSAKTGLIAARARRQRLRRMMALEISDGLKLGDNDILEELAGCGKKAMANLTEIVAITMGDLFEQAVLAHPAKDAVNLRTGLVT